jgi:hypothetical protein
VRLFDHEWPLCADTVAKVENRTTLKISRKSIFRHLYRFYRCEARQRRYEGPWSFLSEAIWSLTSLRAKRISGPKKFRSSGGKDFFNTIRQEQMPALPRIARERGRTQTTIAG